MLERYPDLQFQLNLAHFEPIDSSPLLFFNTLDLSLEGSLEELDVIYVYGLSEGALFLQLENWLEAAPGRHLVFLEDELYALHRLSYQTWGKRMLQHPQVHLKFLYEPLDLILELCAEQFPSSRISVITLKKRNKKFASIKMSLLRKTVLWNGLTSERLSSHLLHRNIFSNLQKLPGSFYVNKMKGAFKDIPALICGAGPSLAGVIDEIKQVRDKAIIVGCGSALSALSYFNVRPHFGMAIDPNEREEECLKGCHFRDLPLIYGNRLYPKVFERFKGPYGFLCSPTGTPLEKALEQELGLNEHDIGTDLGREAMSVTTLAVALAQFWGCSPIILAGIDLAYEGNMHYAKGVPVHAPLQKHPTEVGEQVLYRKGAEGKKVATLVKWVMEQATLDQYASRHVNTPFFNATGKGLGFHSIPYRRLSELTLPSISFDVNSAIRACVLSVTRGQLSETLKSWKKSFDKCLELVQQLQWETEGSGKALIYEEDLSQEKAYSTTLGPAVEALERVSLLNIELPFTRQKWRYVQEICEVYQTLLKLV